MFKEMIRKYMADLLKENPDITREELEQKAKEYLETLKAQRAEDDEFLDGLDYAGEVKGNKEETPVAKAFAQKMGEAGAEEEETEEERAQKAFDGYVRKGVFVKGDGITTDPALGGVLVPENWEKEIIKELADEVVVRQDAKVVTLGTGNTYTIKRMKKKPTVGKAAEGSVRTKTGSPEYEEVTYGMTNYYAYPKVTEELLEDNAYNYEADLTETIREEIGTAMEVDYTTGDGANGTPKGILAETAINRVETVTAGKLDFDDIKNLIFSIGAKYRKGSKIYINSNTALHLAKIKDNTGRYIWQTSVKEGEPDKVEGYPVRYLETLPDIAEGNEPIIFGNLKKGYVVVDKAKTALPKRDDLTEPGFVKFHTKKRSGGGPRDLFGLSILKIKETV